MGERHTLDGVHSAVVWVFVSTAEGDWYSNCLVGREENLSDKGKQSEKGKEEVKCGPRPGLREGILFRIVYLA